MKSFKIYLSELFNPKYGTLQPHDNAKISESDKFISHFRSNGILKKLESLLPPDEQATLEELNTLRSIMCSVTPENLQFALKAEVDETSMYQKFIINELKIHVSNDYTSNILDQTDPILMYLKKHFNRARPEQFASANNIPFQVSIAHTALHPAYPSGHALDSFVMEHVMKQIAPNKSQQIEDFCRRMRDSRLHVGLHYPSDNEISKRLANEIIESNLLCIPSSIKESTEKRRKERFERIVQGLQGPMDSEYLQIGHDAFEHENLSQKVSDKVNQLVRDVFGIHPGEAPKPELWAAGHPTIKLDPEKGEKYVSVRPSVINGEDITHNESFPEIYKAEADDVDSGRRIPHMYGRIDHVRKSISMDSLQPRMFSSSSKDRVVKELKERYPGYSIRDFMSK